MILCGIYEFYKFFTLKRFWGIFPSKECCANQSSAAVERVKLNKIFEG
jgi:hypothetical protein